MTNIKIVRRLARELMENKAHKGNQYRITEYDGYEMVETPESIHTI